MVKKLYLSAILMLSAIGCVSDGPTLREYQSECERRTTALRPMVSCLKAYTARDPRMADHRDTDLLKLYLAYADAAVLRVEQGVMSESDARLALAELYSRLKSTAISREANESVAYSAYLQGLGTYRQASRPAYIRPNMPINCFKSGNYMSCW